MFTNKNDLLDGRVTTIFPSGSEVVVQRAAVELLAADLTLNNFGKVGILPAGCEPVAMYVQADELDSGVDAITLDVGLLNSDGTAFVGTPWATGLTVAQAGGVVQVLSAAMLDTAADDTQDRVIGVKVSAAPGTAAAGTLKLHTHYIAA